MKIQYVISSFFITFMIYNTTMVSQNDTIFYNQKWKKTTKSQAVFYRPLPLQQNGNKYLVKDYYLDGTLQFEAWSKTIEPVDYIGRVVWYYPNGNKSKELNFENNKREGAQIKYYENGKIRKERQFVNDTIKTSKTYNQEGSILTTLIYKNNRSYEGIDECFVKYKKGNIIGKTLYYENTSIPAFISKQSEEGDWTIETHYSIKGDIIYKNKVIGDDIQEGDLIEYYKSKDCGYVLGIKSIKTYKNGRLNGPFTRYDLNGEVMYKGTYKNSYPQDGTFEATERGSYLIFVSEYKNGKKNGAYAVYDYEGNLLAEATYKNNKPYDGIVVINNEWRIYKNGERLRENVHIDQVEEDNMKAFSKGSDKIEGYYDMGSFEVASSIVFLDTYQFLFSLSTGSLDMVTYGAYHLKKGKLKLKVPEEQKQSYTIYGSKDTTMKDSIKIINYNYNARTKPLIQINKQWYSMLDLEQEQELVWGRVDSFKIGVNKLSSLKIGVMEERSGDADIIINSLLETDKTGDYNAFIIVYNIANKYIIQFEGNTFTIKDGNLIDGEKEKVIKPISEEEKENVLDYIIENKSFPYYIKNNTFQKIKFDSKHSNQKISKYIQLNKK